MRSASKRFAVAMVVCAAISPCEAAQLTFHVDPAASKQFAAPTERTAAWSEALSSLGLFDEGKQSSTDILVTSADAAPDPGYPARIDRGLILILEGASPLAAAFGFKASTDPSARPVAVRSVVDLRSPKLDIVWQDSVSLPKFDLPAQAKVFAKEKWQGAPLMAGYRQGAGAVLWLATSLGQRGYSRYPYMPQALADLGFEAPFRGNNTWAFFDSSYRLRADVDYLAPRWRKAGISALHVAAWHYWERDTERDDYLRHLIEACHRNAIQVYAWVELPHVSEQFWADHAEWREKTALGQDAQLDWRKLMNLTNRDAFAAVSLGLRDLVGRFDWDGVNLAELYFESLEGADNPSRFTPMNDDVRKEFRAASGIDPISLFTTPAPANAAELRKRFLDFRAELARRQQTEWMEQIELLRSGPSASKPWLDLVLTHVDDRLDTTMREKIGADASKTLPLLKRHDFTFLVEDPATLWDLGPQRYPQIASRYAGITPRPEKLAIDINVVERYQDVYPTKQQTGSELFQLLHVASEAFPRVTLYFENSILVVDLPQLAAASAQVDHASATRNSGDAAAPSETGAPYSQPGRGSADDDHRTTAIALASGQSGSGQSGWSAVDHASPQRMEVASQRGVGVVWPLSSKTPAALVDGQLWPIGNDSVQWLPPGAHTVESTTQRPVLRVLDLNATLRSAQATPDGVEFIYESSSRALATIEGTVTKLAIDGVDTKPEFVPVAKDSGTNPVLLLPPGQHMVAVTR